jgi:hypothetical protein
MLIRRLLVPLLALATVATAQTTVSTPAPPVGNIAQVQTPPTVFSRIRGLFDVDLPQFDPPGTFRLHLNPHFGDLFHKKYIRITTGVEWASTDFLSFRADADAFGTHGLRRGPAHFGIGQLHLGGKYLFQEFLRPNFETSVGLNMDLPTGRPPDDFTDGHNHYSPYLILQHHSDEHPHLTTFYGTSLDLITPSHAGGGFGRNQPHHDSVALNTGAVYDMGQIKWTLQGTYQTTAIIGGAHPDHYFTLRPSLLWYIPKKYTFNGKTQWILGVGARATWGPDGQEFSTGTRVQADLTFGQAVERLRGAFNFRR